MVNRSLLDREFAVKQVQQEKKLLQETEDKVKHVVEAQQGLQVVAEAIQTQAHKQISCIVTKCLKMIFGTDSYEFRIDFKRARGKTEASLTFVKDGEVFEPTEESGYGPIDVAAFALRIACIRYSHPRLRKLIISDEPMKWLNGEIYQERVGEFLLSLAKEWGMQFIFISDDDWLHVGKVIEL